MAPQKWVTLLLTFLLALLARKYGIEVHAACALSNHWHMVITDVAGKLPSFLRDFNSLAARALNQKRGFRDSVWSPTEETKVCLLADAGAVVDKIVYTLANPVKEGLVRAAGDWPGLRTTPEDYVGGPRKAKRPDFFFDADGTLPQEVELRVTVPPSHAGQVTTQEFRDLIVAGLRREEQAMAAELEAGGHRYPSIASIRRIDPRKCATKPEKRGRSSLPSPIIARDEVSRRVAEARLRGFHDAYRNALELFRGGARDVAWPPGTWWMTHFYRCPEAAAPERPPPAPA